MFLRALHRIPEAFPRGPCPHASVTSIDAQENAVSGRFKPCRASGETADLERNDETIDAKTVVKHKDRFRFHWPRRTMVSHADRQDELDVERF